MTTSRLIAIGCLFLAGCDNRGPGGRWSYPTTRVVGAIDCAGTRVRGGWVTLMPAGGTVGDHVIVPIGEDGSFATDEAPIGRLQIRINVPPAHLPAGAPADRLRLLRSPGSPIQIATTQGQTTRFVFDLVRSPIVLARGG